MKIGIIPPATKTGESRYFENLVEGLIKRDIQVDILDNWVLNKPTKRMFMGSYGIKNIIKNKNLSVLHNTDNLGPFLLRNITRESNVISTVHDIAPVILPYLYNPIMKFHFRTILPKLISNSTRVITDSNSTKEDLLYNFKVDESKINVIPLGIDLSFFYRRDLNEDILKKYSINGDYILYIGTDSVRKNLKNLLLSYFDIFDKIPHNLVLVGPIKKDNLMKMIQENQSLNGSRKEISNRIILTGFVDQEDLPYLYSSASLFILPSLYEGFGFPPLEAMACGVPVITSKNSSLTEIVQDAGLFIENPLDPEEISDKILCLLSNENLQKDLVQRGLNLSKKYSWDITIIDTINVYTELSE